MQTMDGQQPAISAVILQRGIALALKKPIQLEIVTFSLGVHVVSSHLGKCRAGDYSGPAKAGLSPEIAMLVGGAASELLSHSLIRFA
ncbi:MAG: hypothetical protein WD768_20605 [Phycisphaeraceae bacterium]